MRARKRLQPRQLFQHPDATVVELSEKQALPLLQSGKVVGGHRIPWGSNYTVMVWIEAGQGKVLGAIYKPRDGERPLYDFPSGSLYKREYATFVFSRALGWPDVPLTLIRDGPYGVGSMQLYVKCDPEITYFDLVDDKTQELLRLAVFDLLANNADRKAGHCLLGDDGKVWSIDHGLTFHSSLKLRTVMLEFWGQPIPESLLADIDALLARLSSSDGLAKQLTELLEPDEIKALTARLQFVLNNPVLPSLDPYHDVPWPWL